MLMVIKSNNSNEQAINEIIRLMQTDQSVDAPEDAVKRAKNIFLSKAAEPKQSLVQKVFAVLQVNLSPRTAVFGERSTAAVRQMLFEAGDASIDLRITEGEQGFSLAGQILSEDFTGAEITLSNAKKSITARAGQLSEFKFENLAQGKYTLTITQKDRQIEIENLEIE